MRSFSSDSQQALFDYLMHSCVFFRFFHIWKTLLQTFSGMLRIRIHHSDEYVVLTLLNNSALFQQNDQKKLHSNKCLIKYEHVN